VIVYEAKGLPGGDLPDPPDPYVKLYLLPERSKKSKRKTEAIKDTVTPVFNETFEYEIPALKIPDHQLEVSVVDRKGVFSRGSTIGRCVIDLDQVMSKEINQKWFDLIEVDEDSD
jgi:Ca2+-dependent lipid-binding protein